MLTRCYRFQSQTVAAVGYLALLGVWVLWRPASLHIGYSFQDRVFFSQSSNDKTPHEEFTTQKNGFMRRTSG